MERDFKLFFGVILGEVYRLQKMINEDLCPAGDSTIYGLVNGIEDVIDSQIDLSRLINSEQMENANSILRENYISEEKIAEFNGFYDIEEELNDLGIDRALAIRIFKYIKGRGDFPELFEKMDSAGSPGECRGFNINEIHR